MNIKTAQKEDLNIISQYDRHLAANELEYCILRNRVYIAEENGEFIGWLRYNLFWDNTPFLNMLYLLDGYRGKGFGKQLVEYWEIQMKRFGYGCVLTSTASDEYAQHFYHKLGYRAIGGFSYQFDPYEIIFTKEI